MATNNNATAEGLREILFDALNRVINKEITPKEVESVCFISEQMIKTARVELEIYQEGNKEQENLRQHQLRMERERGDSIKMLSEAIDVVEEVEDEQKSL